MTATDDKRREEREALAAELALGVLSGEERRNAEHLAATDVEFAGLVDSWRERLLPMADAYAPVAPPAAVKRAVEARLYGAENRSAAGWWNSLALWRPLAIAASLAVIVLAGLEFYPRAPVSPPLVAALAAEGGPVRYLAYFDGGRERLTLTRLDQPAPQDRDHELWLIAGGNAPVSLGVLGRDEDISIALRPELSAQIATGAVLAVSDEPLGGSSTGAPTGAVIAAGPVKSF
jgi:anti-sigma-K factor RskA